MWNRPHPRQREGPRDIWRVFRYHLPSRESWPVIWVWSTLLALHQDQARRERLARAGQELDDLQRTLAGPRPRRRTREAVTAHVRGILARLQVTRYLHVQVLDAPEYRYRQEHRGRPGPATRYRRITRDRFRLAWHTDEEALGHDRASDGMFPRRPTAEQVLRLFSLIERHTVRASDQVLQVIEPTLTPLQKQVLHLLGIPERVYHCPDAG